MRLAALLLTLILGTQNPGPSFPGATASGSAACTVPTGTYDWQANTILGTTNCGTTGTTSCTNNVPTYHALEGFASNTASQTANTNAQPLFLASQINGLPAWGFDGANSHTVDALLLTTPIPTTNTTYSFFATLSPSNVTATNKILGQSVATTGAVRWYISSTGHQTVSGGSSASISATSTLVVNTWVTIGFTWNTSSGALTFYKCSGGVCSTDGTSTTTATPTQTINVLGESEGSSNFKGLISEIWYDNGISSSGWGPWSQCKYGI